MNNTAPFPSHGSRLPLSGSIAEQVRFGLTLLALAACVLCGGSARADVAALLYLRPLLVLCVAAMLLTPGRWDFRALRIPFLLLAAWAGVMLIQLIPLPPGLWQALPGRSHYAEAAAAAGMAQPWRPISLTPDLTWNSVLALLPPLAMLIGLAGIRRDQSQALLQILIGLACASAILGILQLQAGPESPLFFYRFTHSGSAVGFFSNRNHEAALLAMTFPLLRLWTMQPHPSAQWRRTRLWTALGIAMFLAPMVLVTGSRAGLGLSLLAIVAALFLAPLPLAHERRGWRDWRLIAVIAVIAVMAVLTLVFGRAVAVQRLMSLNVDGELRFSQMPVLLEMLKAFEPVGTGFGSFDPVYRNFEPDAFLSTSYFNHAHNELIEVALTGGVLALAVLAAFLAWWLRGSIKAFVPYASRSCCALLARAGAIMVLILLAASIVDYPLRTPLMAAIFAIAAAWLARGRWTSAGGPRE